jgi:hypothetical protein
MPHTKPGSVPKYRHHKARNCAVVTINGRDYYLGPFGSPESQEKYEQLLRAWRQRQTHTKCTGVPADGRGRGTGRFGQPVAFGVGVG